MNDFKHHFYQKLLDLRLPKDNHPSSKYSSWWVNHYPLPIEGCTLEEIGKLKQAQKVTILPEIYEAYLQVAGKAFGDVFIGFDISYYAIKDLKDDLQELIVEDGVSRILPPETFVFLTQQGHTYWYFSALEDSYNPPVYLYLQEIVRPDWWHEKHGTDENPKPFFAHLSELLTEFITEREGKEAQMQFLREHVVRK